MPALPAESVAALARAAGFTGDALITAVAIAKGESGFNPAAAGDVGIQTAVWGPSIGLWQIRSLKADFGTGKPRDAQKLTDPAFNARSAFSISGGGKNFRPWTVYTSGAYLRHKAEATKAVSVALYANPGNTYNDVAAGIEKNPVTGALVDVGKDTAGAAAVITNPLSAIADLAKTLNDPETWSRVLQVIAGMAALVLGAVLLSKEVAPEAVAGVVGMAAS